MVGNAPRRARSHTRRSAPPLAIALYLWRSLTGRVEPQTSGYTPFVAMRRTRRMMRGLTATILSVLLRAGVGLLALWLRSYSAAKNAAPGADLRRAFLIFA